MDGATINYLLDVLIAVLGIIISGGLTYVIGLLKKVVNTNNTLNLNINTISINMDQIKKDIVELKDSKEENREEIAKLKMLYAELHFKIQSLIDKIHGKQ